VLDRHPQSWANALLLGLAALAFAPAGAGAGIIADYESVSIRVWGHAPRAVYVWTRTDAGLDLYCDPGHTVPAKRIAACADLGGPRIILSWPEWRRMDRVGRCRLHAHEWGHLLGWDHEDGLFEAMERRAKRLCKRRFIRPGWFLARPGSGAGSSPALGSQPSDSSRVPSKW
jgi:hypothetical protein